MSSGGNIIFLIQALTFVGGLICALLTAFLPFFAFSSDAPNSHRVGSALTFLFGFVLGLPMAMALSGNAHNSLSVALSDGDLYRAYLFAFCGCMMINEIAMLIVSKMTGWWANEPFAEQPAMGRALAGAMFAVGGGTLGFYFGSGLEWAALGLLLGVGFTIFSEAGYRKEYEMFQNMPRNASVRQAQAEIDGEVVSYNSPQQPATPTYGRPPQDVTSGFDVPPQR